MGFPRRSNHFPFAAAPLASELPAGAAVLFSNMPIAVRDWDDAEDRARLERVGFDHILEKPALFVGLRALLEHSAPAEAMRAGKPLNVFQRLLAWLGARSPATSASLP